MRASKSKYSKEVKRLSIEAATANLCPRTLPFHPSTNPQMHKSVALTLLNSDVGTSWPSQPEARMLFRSRKA